MASVAAVVFFLVIQPPPLPQDPAESAYEVPVSQDVQEVKPVRLVDEGVDVPKSVAPDASVTRSVPPPPPELLARLGSKRKTLLAPGLHGMVSAGLMLVTGYKYDYPQEIVFPDPGMVHSQLLVTGLYTLKHISPAVSLGVEVGLRSGSPLPLLHAGVKTVVSWRKWALHGYVRGSVRKDSDDPADMKESSGMSMGAGFYYALPKALGMGNATVVGASLEYWWGNMMVGDKAYYDDGSGSFNNKLFLMEMGWLW